MIKQLSLEWKRLAQTLLCGVAMGMLAFCIQQIVALWTGHAPIRLEDMVRPQHYWGAFIFTVACAPFIEELISRKVIIDFALKKNVPIIYALLASAFFFSSGHLPKLWSAEAIFKTAVLSDTFLNGVVLAAIYLKMRKLIYPVVAHAVINVFLIVPKAMLEANVNSQNSVVDYIPFIAVASVLLFALIAFAWTLSKDAIQASTYRSSRTETPVAIQH